MSAALKKDANIYNGNLEIRTQADADKWENLTEVTGHLSIYSSAKLDALTSVGGYLYINSSAKLDAPKLYAPGFDDFQVLDGIGCVVTSSKEKDGFTILSCRHSKIKDGKIVGDKFYVAQKDGENAHGKTIGTALNELQFKIGPRDVSKYRNMPMTTKKSPEDWALVYRLVTGACQYGTQDFMQRKGKLKKTYTLAEVIAETKGAYGHQKFVEVVGAP